MSFIFFLLYAVYNIVHSINFLTVSDKKIDSIATTVMYWIMEIQMFGLFYSALFLNQPLRNILLPFLTSTIIKKKNKVHDGNKKFGVITNKHI
uniref:Uncharacterized protein n=1 Tax=Strongyloides venezuelensis TaxID=75913 RepID=A0A0K0FS79_STRVS